MKLRAIFAALAIFLASPGAGAEERIADFDVAIEVEKDGDILVAETISVIAEGNAIQRGIFRDLPRFYLKGAQKLPYYYDIKDVTRDGRSEPYAVEKDGNAYRIRIGDADVFLANGLHTYHIAYEVKNQVRYFERYDEVYWNVTGNYWQFPIDHVKARIMLPRAASAVQTAAYSGREGSNSRNSYYAFRDGAHIFETAEALGYAEGLTVAIGFDKGIVDPPSAEDARADWFAVNASRILLAIAFLAIGAYYLFAFQKVGRDPPKGPIFARYEPPAGYSPAAVHRIFYRGLSGHDALIATIMNLAIRRKIEIGVKGRKETTLTWRGRDDAAEVNDDDIRLLRDLFGGAPGSLEFGGKYNATLTAAYTAFQRRLASAYGAPYFKLNYGFLVVALVLSALAVIAAANISVEWTWWHTAAAGGLFAMGAAAAYFLPAPTQKGQNIRTEIEGFRLYLKTAEELHLNSVEVGSDAPPPMSVERYERFLPYAIALGVEKPWTEHFEKLMPKEAADYTPRWGGGYISGRSLSGLNSALVSGLSSGVSSSLPQSSGSSGSGGGGSSGGGGGGGGGGGW